jgi:CyaY protein
MLPGEFMSLAETTLQSIEQALENLTEVLDIDSERSGNVLTLTCDNGSKIIINSQEAMQEIWLAAKSGGFHFRLVGQAWCDSKSGHELFQVLSQCLSQQTGTPVRL